MCFQKCKNSKIKNFLSVKFYKFFQTFEFLKEEQANMFCDTKTHCRSLLYTTVHHLTLVGTQLTLYLLQLYFHMYFKSFFIQPNLFKIDFQFKVRIILRLVVVRTEVGTKDPRGYTESHLIFYVENHNGFAHLRKMYEM